MSEASTRDIRIKVSTQYVPERSDPSARRWLFAYRVRIANEGSQTVQLLSRHWVITDANGHVEEVKGPGVVGQQPILEPGDRFEYTSACPLSTSFGIMNGTYQMITTDGEQFDAEIAPFSLGEPDTVH
jgi:ApaG protein